MGEGDGAKRALGGGEATKQEDGGSGGGGNQSSGVRAEVTVHPRATRTRPTQGDLKQKKGNIFLFEKRNG